MSGRPSAVKRIRKNFGKIRKIVEIPDLIGMQRESFTRFLQMDVAPEDRRDVGLQAVFKSVFPIKDFTGSASLEFVSYRFAEIKHSEEECVQRGMTYELPVRITVRLVVYEIDKDTGVSNIRDIKEQEIYFGTIPLMTAKGTFIINGTERVVVSQLHRSSGVFFDHDKGKTHSSGKIVYSSRIIPVRGSWIDMEIDPKDIIHIRIDRRRKFPITILFKAFGYSTEDILAYFYSTDKIIIKGKQLYKAFDPELLKGQRATKDIKDPDSGEVVVKKGRMYTKRSLKHLSESGLKMIPISAEEIEGRVSAGTLIDPASEAVIVGTNGVIDEEIFENIMGAGKAYVPQPWFWSDQYDVKLQIAGLGTGYDAIVERRGDGAVSFWYYAGDRLIAIDAMNDPRAYMVGKRLIEAGRSADKALVADVSADLKPLLKP